jgi:hypothetical protein
MSIRDRALSGVSRIRADTLSGCNRHGMMLNAGPSTRQHPRGQHQTHNAIRFDDAPAVCLIE